MYKQVALAFGIFFFFLARQLDQVTQSQRSVAKQQIKLPLDHERFSLINLLARASFFGNYTPQYSLGIEHVMWKILAPHFIVSSANSNWTLIMMLWLTFS